MQRLRLLTLCLLSVLGVVISNPAAEKKAAPKPHRVQPTNVLGAEGFVLSGSALQAVVAPTAGGRIIEYSVNGQNCFGDAAAASLSTPNRWLGYQCDLGFDTAGQPARESAWNGPWQAKAFTDFGVKLTSAVDPLLGVQLEKEILIEPESGDLGITQRLRNASKKEVSHSLWGRTIVQGGGFVFFPLKKKSQFPARWLLRIKLDGKMIDEIAKPRAANIQVLRNVLVAKCDGEAFELGADSDAGWIAYVRGRLLLVRYFPSVAKGHYSDHGKTVGLNFDGRVAEVQAVSPEMKLKPGEAYAFPEKWTLIELDSRITLFDEVRALVDKLPESPF